MTGSAQDAQGSGIGGICEQGCLQSKQIPLWPLAWAPAPRDLGPMALGSGHFGWSILRKGSQHEREW